MVHFRAVIASHDLEHVVIARTPDPRLPRLDDGEGAAGLARRLELFLRRVVAGVTLVHWAPLSPIERVAGAGAEPAYCAAVFQRDARPSRADFAIASCDALLATGALPAGDQRLLADTRTRMRQPVEAFDSYAQTATALTWAEQHVRRSTGDSIVSPVRHRCGRCDYVVAFRTCRTMHYFKSGPGRVTDEAMLTQRLWERRPRQFAETVAMDHREQRWLHRELPGTMLRGQLLAVGSGVAAAAAAAAARALGTVQKAVLGAADVEAHLASRAVTAVELYRRTDDIVRQTFRSITSDDEHASVIEAWRFLAGAVERRCVAIDALGLPRTLVLSDFWTDNILVTPDGIGFLDVGNSYWTYPYLSLWRFVRDVERRLGAPAGARAAIEEAFVDAWADRIPPRDMRRALAEHLPCLGQMFGIVMASCDLDRYERALGSALPPGHRAARLAPRIRALLAMSALGVVRPAS